MTHHYDHQERDPNGIDVHAGGAKLDAGKAPMLRGLLRYFPRALSMVAQVSQYGSRKYSWGGWKTVEDGITRYGDALVRHLLEVGADKDSGLPHAAHAAWNALAHLELLLKEAEEDAEIKEERSPIEAPGCWGYFKAGIEICGNCPFRGSCRARTEGPCGRGT